MNRSRQSQLPLAVYTVLAIALACLLGCGGSHVPAPALTPTLRPTFTPAASTGTPRPPQLTPTSLSVLSAGTSQVPAFISSTSGSIAFVSNRDGFSKIFVVNTDGSALTCLTKDQANYWDPDWSPDGKRIVFASDRDSPDGEYNAEIYVMNADGSGRTRLTDHPAHDIFPDWSPDGTRIAFTSDRDGNEEIYVMSADGSGPIRLTDNPADDAYPDWSPEGDRIVYISGRGEEYEDVWVMNADGTGKTRLTYSPLADGTPRWSPDGTRIAFVSWREDTGSDIYTMNPDGSGVTLLADNPGVPISFAWSPDGTHIAFSAYYNVDPEDHDSEIFIINIDGSGQTRLTDNPAWDHSPAWSPNPLPATATTQLPQELPFVVSGMLRYRKQTLVPDNAKVIVAWLGEIHGYIFGEGAIDGERGSFEIVFDAPPPAQALNSIGSSACGLGVLLLTTDEKLKTGSVLSDSSVTDFLGASEDYAITYISGSCDPEEEDSWVDALRQGYSAVRRIGISGSDSGYEPTDPASIEIIIDDLENLEPPNG